MFDQHDEMAQLGFADLNTVCIGKSLKDPIARARIGFIRYEELRLHEHRAISEGYLSCVRLCLSDASDVKTGPSVLLPVFQPKAKVTLAKAGQKVEAPQ